jgi:hypothetical protein
LRVRFDIPRPFSLFCLYVILLILLPSGTIFGLPVKIPVFLPLLALGLKLSFQEDNCLFECGFNISIVAAFVAWLLLSQLYPMFSFTNGLSQFKDIVTTLIGCWIIRVFTKTEQDLISFLRVCVYTVAFGSFIKLFIFIYSLRTGVSIASIIDGISNAFGVQLMVMDFGDVGGRLQFASDTLLPMCIFAVLCARTKLRIGSITSVLVTGLLIFSAIFTFSRFLWGNTALAVLLGLLVAKKEKVHLIYIAAATAVSVYFFDLLYVVVTLRLSNNIADSSDIERVVQGRTLHAFFMDAPLFGHGLGSYAVASIRAIDLPYIYELQVPALLGQVGIVGMMLFSFLLFNHYRKAFRFKSGNMLYQSSILLMLLAFLASGFFNPTLLTSAAAVSFGLIFSLARMESAVWTRRKASCRYRLHQFQRFT